MSQPKTMVGYTVRAMASVKRDHCQPPNYRPMAAVHWTMICPRCAGRLNFTVSAEDGRTTGRCNSADCVRWVE